MQIIVLHPRLPRVRHFTLSRGKLLACILLLCLAVALASSALTWVVARTGLAGMGAPARAAGEDPYLRANLNVLAARVGEIQARMVRLDALGERVSGLAGIAPKEFNFQQPPGRGGPAPSAQSRASTLPELQLALAQLSDQAERHADYFDVVASTLLDRQIQARRIPRVLPVATGYDASGFGWRFDPFTGRRTPHDGVDFAAPAGTPIVAAAGGVVVAAEWHPEYGNLIDIDHGNGLKTRYAHASRMLVKAGDLVKPGQQIALVGSTGRSTGSHLHFEVHVDGVPQNPNRFLAVAKAAPAQLAQAPVPTDRNAIR
ncbi:M23 family metallopeptidase [Cupriavidus basilensis]|uniref:M23 family metallopeptidase n=1 Tax=Cupriavidus basilensis TaxID=68895 RepID=A0ABT6AZT5_9BURK|nr:M23 family metallopeptidase [Cupriavidus basilensis]MDF3838139.1 M23 family metallopeptidase [Cupriavidus basilensis]